MGGRREQWPQALLAPWAWHPEPGRVSRGQGQGRSGDGVFFASRALVVSTALSVVFVAGGLVGWTSGAFSSAAANSGNSFQASTSFCPRTVTVTATADSWVQQDSPDVNHGSDPNLFVQSKVGAQNRRTLVRFALPTAPAGCPLTSATLRLFAKSSEGTRTIQAFRAAAAWTETGVTWNNQPATTGGAATSPSGTGWHSWSVTAQVEAMYSGSNDGFVLRDSVEDEGAFAQNYTSREDAPTDPELTVTFG